MRQRNLSGIVLLLAVGLTALAQQVPAQNVGTPAGWAPPAEGANADKGNEPVAGPVGAPAVIASSRPALPGYPPEAKLPLPPDGLSAILPRPPTPTARPARPAAKPAPAEGGVERALYVGKPDTGNADRAVIPASAVVPKRETRSVGDGSMLALEVKGPASSAPGQTLSYTIIAHNVGSVVLAGVHIELPLPDGLRIIASEPAAEFQGKTIEKVGWTLGNLEVGSKRLMKLDLMTNDPGELHLCPAASFSVAVGLRTRIVRPPFSLVVTGPERATVGGPIVWNIQVGNYTASPLQRATLTCRLSAGLGHHQGDTIETDVSDLASGQVKPLKLEVQALRPGRQVISIAATTEGGRTAQAQGIVMVDEMSLVLTPQGPRSARSGEELSYQVDVINPANTASGPIRLTQVLPEGLEFVSVSTGGLYNPATQTITWALDGLPAQSRRQANFHVRARKGGDWALAGAVQVEGLPEVHATHAVHVSAAPSLTMEATAHEDPLGQGSETTYEVRVVNQGPTADGVRLRMLLPDNLLAIQASAPTRWQIQGQQVLFDPIDQMRNRVAAVYRVRVRGIHQGMGRFRVELTAEGLAQPMLHELSCRVAPAAPPPPRPLASASHR